MAKDIKLWRVTDDHLVEIPQDRLDLESRLEDWMADDIGVLDPGLLVIGRQLQTDFGGIIDLLCIDSSGDLVIVELKRDRTPRDVTAQILDYASWVVDLSAEQVTEIADRHLGSMGPLDIAFKQTFDEELPDVVNESHKMLVVGSSIDPNSERIIRYLSNQHGVNINAITFQYFRLPSGEEAVGRVHLLEPEDVEHRTRIKPGSKRRSDLSLEDLERIADSNGVGELYRVAVAELEQMFKYTQTTRSSIRWAASFEDRKGAVLSLLPTKAVPGQLPFQLYTHRAEKLFEKSQDELLAALPSDTVPWEYSSGDGPWWKGHEGLFRSLEDVTALRDVIQPAD